MPQRQAYHRSRSSASAALATGQVVSSSQAIGSSSAGAATSSAQTAHRGAAGNGAPARFLGARSVTARKRTASVARRARRSPCRGTCLTGPVNAIISASGDPRRHYTAGILVGILALGFGLASPVFVGLMLATPKAFIAALAGLAMLRVLQTAFTISFKEKFTLGALVTFLVTVADVAIFNIGAPFWGLVFGFAASWLLERGDFRAAAR